MATLFNSVDIFGELFDVTTADLYSLFIYEYGDACCLFRSRQQTKQTALEHMQQMLKQISALFIGQI